jgi:hypothetical protein
MVTKPVNNAPTMSAAQQRAQEEREKARKNATKPQP